MTVEKYIRRRVEEYNAMTGDLDKEDGFDCPVCKNRGYTAFVHEEFGTFYDRYAPCHCNSIRNSIRRMKRSGLETSVRDCTFERFEVKHEWQRKMVEVAKAYLATGVGEGKWLFMGGAVGCGKTHICTAVARILLYERGVYYMSWPDEVMRLKSLMGDGETFARELDRLNGEEVLYIDDFMKPVMNDHPDRDGVYRARQPSPADIRIAYQLLNHRYIRKKPTLISSERYLSELMDVDDSVASRIAERSSGYCVTLARDRAKNHRIIPVEVRDDAQ